MKKIIITVIAMLAAASMLTACNKTEDKVKKDDTSSKAEPSVKEVIEDDQTNFDEITELWVEWEENFDYGENSRWRFTDEAALDTVKGWWETDFADCEETPEGSEKTSVTPAGIRADYKIYHKGLPTIYIKYSSSQEHKFYLTCNNKNYYCDDTAVQALVDDLIEEEKVYLAESCTR